MGMGLFEVALLPEGGVRIKVYFFFMFLAILNENTEILVYVSRFPMRDARKLP